MRYCPLRGCNTHLGSILHLHNEADSFDELSVTQLKGWFAAAAESERVLTVRRQESIMFVVCARLLESTLKYDVSYATRLSQLSGICLLLRAPLFLALRAADPVSFSHPLSQPAYIVASCDQIQPRCTHIHSIYISLLSAWLHLA